MNLPWKDETHKLGDHLFGLIYADPPLQRYQVLLRYMRCLRENLPHRSLQVDITAKTASLERI